MTADNNIAADTLDPPEEAHDDPTPMQDLDRAAAKRELDELFFLAKAYRSSKEFKELLDFIVRFRFYAPYNAMLLHVQKPDATVVATARKWYAEYGRTIRPGARALVILQPMGPVMFVFDVSDTERGDDAQDLPALVEQPFGARGLGVLDVVRFVQDQ